MAIASIETLIAPLRLPGLVFQVDLRQWYGVGINVIRQGLWLALIVLLREYHAPLSYVVGARIVVATVEAVLIWFASLRFFSASATVLWHKAPHYLKESFPVAISSLLAGVYLRIDQVMLHNMVNDRVLGQYAAAVKVSELLEAVPAALLFCMAPILSIAAGVQMQFHAYQSRTFRYLNVCAAGLCVVMTVGAPLIISGSMDRNCPCGAAASDFDLVGSIDIFCDAGTEHFGGAKPTTISRRADRGRRDCKRGSESLLDTPIRRGRGRVPIATVASYTIGWMVILLFFSETRPTIYDGWRTALPALLVAGCSVGVAAVIPWEYGWRLLVGVLTFTAGVLLSRLIHREDVAFLIVGGGGGISEGGIAYRGLGSTSFRQIVTSLR